MYPRQYENGLDITWIIDVDMDKRIKFTFEEIELEANRWSGCYDKVSVSLGRSLEM